MVIIKGTLVGVPNKKEKEMLGKNPAGILGLCTPYQNQTTIHGWEVKISVQNC